MDEKHFSVSLLISAAAHVAVIGGGYFGNLAEFSMPNASKEVEVTYCDIKQMPKSFSNVSPLSKIGAKKGLRIDKDTKGQLQAQLERKSLSTQEKDKLRTDVGLPNKREELSKAPKELDENKSIPKDKILRFNSTGRAPASPAYLSYFQEIRDSIRKHALRNYTLRSQEGDIYVSFTLSKGGSLLSLTIENGRSDQNDYLRDLAKESIRSAAPFAGIPDELSQREISFNVLLSFRCGSLRLSRR